MVITRSSTWYRGSEQFASAADFKGPIRAKIEQAGYTIVANIGDQASDLQAVAQRKVPSAKSVLSRAVTSR
jgi:hypothetical protein